MKHFLLLLSFIFTVSINAYTPSEKAKISVLTCSSGKEIYKVYGHSAIRFQDQKRDLVFNYGLFSFDEPHFLWRYLRGQNFYLLGVETYRRFINRYERGGEKVTQQTLNLNHEEVVLLFDALIENANPANREYLYNVFYDNCATRVYRIIEDVTPGGIIWDNNCQDASFRDLLHQHNYPMPFSQMGIDLVFGAKADKTTTCREQMFLPLRLQEELTTAQRADKRKLISNTEVLLPGIKIHNNKEIIIFNLTLALMLLLAMLVRFWSKRFLRLFQIIFYSIVGLSSLVVCFIAFFSIHPTVLPNYNLIWINPLCLILAIRLLFKKRFNFSWQKILNGWSMLVGLYLLMGLFGVVYIHYGLYYILLTLIMISYKGKAYR